MKFYGREEELKTLRDTSSRSRKTSQFTVVLGRRRIGKTRLILEATREERRVYLFVSRIDEELLCQRMQESVREAGIETIGTMKRFRDILMALMVHSRTEPLTVIVDEFQEFENINPGIFEDVQEIWDTQKEKAHINLIVAGSVHSMMVRIFESRKEPLFERPTSNIELRPLPVSVMKRMMSDLNPGYANRDLLTLHMLTGGVPQYIEALADSGEMTADRMLERALSPGSIFLKDGKDLVTSEFGKENKTYLSVLQLIAGGKCTRGEMEDVLGVSLGEYLKRLEREYGFIRKRTPVLSRKERLSRWEIADMYLRFYYRYVQPNQAYMEAGRNDLLLRTVKRDLESYEGRVLEDYFLKMASEEWTYTSIGSEWSRDGSIEIDLVVLDSFERKAILAEIKRNPGKLDMEDLKSKEKAVEPYLSGYDVELRGLSMDDM